MSVYRTILCPVDFSSSSRAAYDKAIDLAVASGASIMLMHVYETPLNLPSIIFDAAFLGRIARTAQDQLDSWKKDGDARGVRVDTMNVTGIPWDRIVTRAREGRHDLVVVGTHGRTGLRLSIVGSVAERVVRHSPCSVLVVRAGDPSPAAAVRP